MKVRYPRHIGIKHKIKYALLENIYLEQWQVPKGTEVITFQTENFGWIVLPQDTKDVRGFTIPKRIFKN